MAPENFPVSSQNLYYLEKPVDEETILKKKEENNIRCNSTS